MSDAPAVPAWEEPRAVSMAIARTSSAGQGGPGQLLVPGGIAIAVLYNSGLLFNPLIIMLLIVIGVIGAIGMAVWRKRSRRQAELARWEVSLLPQGIIRRGPREEALPWDAVASLLLRGYPGASHVVAGVTLRDGSEWCFGVADHPTAKAVAAVAAAKDVNVRMVNLES